MSEQSCDNCISWDRAINACGNILVSDAHPDKHSNLSKWLASICRHYSERVELCGAKHPYFSDVHCRLLSGHEGEHNESAVRWPDPTPTVEAKCGNKLQAADIAEDTFCDKPAGHKGKHCNSRDTNYGKRLIIWFGPSTSSQDPTPTAFDKAWEEHRKDNSVYASYEGLFRAGWQARGKADLCAVDTRLTDHKHLPLEVGIAMGKMQKLDEQ